MSKAPLMMRGSIGRPFLVVRPACRHERQASSTVHKSRRLSFLRGLGQQDEFGDVALNRFLGLGVNQRQMSRKHLMRRAVYVQAERTTATIESAESKVNAIVMRGKRG
jgi:hypothetical protein